MEPVFQVLFIRFSTKSLFIKFHPIEAITYCIWFGTIMLMIYSNEAYTELSTANFTSIFVVIYIGVFPGALGYLFWGYAFRNIPATVAISSLYFMPIISLFLGWIFLGETRSIYINNWWNNKCCRCFYN